MKVGLAQFSDRPYQEFLLGEYLDKRDLHQKLNGLIYRRGGTNTGQALTLSVRITLVWPERMFLALP